MNPSIEMEFEYAFNCWKFSKYFDDDTARGLKKCMERTKDSEIDKVAQSYSISFMNYVDKRINEV